MLLLWIAEGSRGCISASRAGSMAGIAVLVAVIVGFVRIHIAKPMAGGCSRSSH